LRLTQRARQPFITATALLMLASALAGCLGSSQQTALAPASTAPGGQVREFHIYVNEAFSYEPVKGKTLPAFTFSLDPNLPGSVPGPTLRVTEGDHVRAFLHDNAGVSGHTIHWHGISLPWAMDGVPFMTQTISKANEPGVYVYEFDAKETGTYWYHCHVDAPSHIDLGLFGAFIVEPRDKGVDPPYDREAVLMLHEADSNAFTATFLLFGDTSGVQNKPANPFDAADAAVGSARQAYDIGAGFVVGGEGGKALGGAEGPRDYYPEVSIRYRPQYDVFMINGRSFPETLPVMTKTGDTVRIRIVNAGQLLHTMHLHGHHFLVTHKDGYALPEGARYYADSLVIGPGERYDLYVKSNNPGIWDFHDHGGMWNVGGYTSNDHAFPGGMNTMLVYEDFQYAQLPAPSPDHAWTSGDYMAFAPRYPGVTPPDMMHHEH
jgi:FtsP/CotA-like multicopper oxidase with cupredoxin domain